MMMIFQLSFSFSVFSAFVVALFSFFFALESNKYFKYLRDSNEQNSSYITFLDSKVNEIEEFDGEFSNRKTKLENIDDPNKKEIMLKEIIKDRKNEIDSDNDNDKKNIKKRYEEIEKEIEIKREEFKLAN